jgi:hypothetical protein
MVSDALENLRDCQREFERRDNICRRWTEACGPSVWREGHPSDRLKLLRRREAKHDLRRARWYLAQAMANTPPAGSA